MTLDGLRFNFDHERCIDGVGIYSHFSISGAHATVNNRHTPNQVWSDQEDAAVFLGLIKFMQKLHKPDVQRPEDYAERLREFIESHTVKEMPHIEGATVLRVGDFFMELRQNPHNEDVTNFDFADIYDRSERLVAVLTKRQVGRELEMLEGLKHFAENLSI